MIGRRLISSLAVSRSPTSPTASRRPLAGISGAPLRLAASAIAVLLGRSELPSLAEVLALRPATRVLFAGLSGWIVLVVLITVAAVVSVEMSALGLPEWLSAPASTAGSAAARPPASLENIVQRPLFSRSRQGVTLVQAPMPVAAPTAVTPDRDIALKGVFMNGGLAKAFMLSSQNPLGAWVKAGEEIAGWKVLGVQPEYVVLEGQGEKRSVQLHVGNSK